MGQFIFFTLLIIALIAGTFVYFSSPQKSINPMKFLMDSSGYNTVKSLNAKKTQQMTTMRSDDLAQIRQKMDDLAQRQDEFLNATQDQQQQLKDDQEKDRDLIDEERQKSQDQQLITQQRIEDQEQRIQDQRNQ